MMVCHNVGMLLNYTTVCYVVMVECCYYVGVMLFCSVLLFGPSLTGTWVITPRCVSGLAWAIPHQKHILVEAYHRLRIGEETELALLNLYCGKVTVEITFSPMERIVVF